MEQTDTIFKGLKSFLKDVYLFHPLKAFITLLLMILVGLTNGITLAVLIPLIQVAGIGEIGNSKGYLSKIVLNFFHFFGFSSSLGGVLFVFFLISLIMILLQYEQVKLTSVISNYYSAYIRKRLYDHIFNAQWPFFIKEKMAHSANILTVEAHRVRIATESLIRLISESLVSIFYLVLAFIISWQTTALIVFVSAAISWFMRKYIHSGRDLGKKITDANNDLQSTVWEHLSSAKIIKSHAAEKQSSELFRERVFKVSELYNRLTVNQAGIKAIFDPIAVSMLCIGLYISIVFFKIDMAYIIVLLFIFFRLFPKITAIQQNYHQLLTTVPAYNALVSLEKEIMGVPEYSEDKKTITSFKKGISLKNVTFTYQDSAREILKGVTIFIPRGKTVAFVGESGSGKSTVADLILGLLLSAQGEIYIDDMDITNLDMKSWRSLIGYVTQDTILFHDSVLANLLWANADATYEDVRKALETASADAFVNNLSDGYNTIIGDRGMRLSGGQRQRLALARALLRKPQLLILDEATSSLDADSERRIQEAIESLHGTLTMIVITHRLATVKNADLIYIIDNGGIAESGTWDSLINSRSGYFRSLCELQGLV